MRVSERDEGERSRVRMHVTHVNNAYRCPRVSLPESRTFGSQPTYYLFIRTVPGWSATWRNRLREFAEPAFLAQAPSELCFHSFRFGLSIPVSLSHLLLSRPFSLLRPALLSLLSFPLLHSLSMCPSLRLPLNLYTLSRSSSSTKGYSRSIAPPVLLPLPLSSSPPPLSAPDPCPTAYVIRITIICFESASTAHQSEWQPVTRGCA